MEHADLLVRKAQLLNQLADIDRALPEAASIAAEQKLSDAEKAYAAMLGMTAEEYHAYSNNGREEKSRAEREHRAELARVIEAERGKSAQ